MPQSLDAADYRNRATVWLYKADTLPEGAQREACLLLADGYERLARLLEARTGQQPSSLQ